MRVRNGARVHFVYPKLDFTVAGNWISCIGAGYGRGWKFIRAMSKATGPSSTNRMMLDRSLWTDRQIARRILKKSRTDHVSDRNYRDPRDATVYIPCARWSSRLLYLQDCLVEEIHIPHIRQMFLQHLVFDALKRREWETSCIDFGKVADKSRSKTRK